MPVVDSVLVGAGPVEPATARKEFSRQVWVWYHVHKDDVIYTAFGFIRIRVSHIKKVFEQIAGYERDA